MIEYRVLWIELIAGSLVPKAGIVSESFEDVELWAAFRKQVHVNARDVLIEARRKSEDPWPHPLDATDVWLSNVRSKTNAE